MKVNIYVLIDPRTLKVRYIGRTRCTLKKRLGEHVCIDRSKRITRVKSWIKSLKDINSKPYIRLLTTCEGWEESHTLEQELIERHKIKHDLLNHKDRGAGNPFPFISDFSRLQISSTLKEGYASGRIQPTRTKEVYVYTIEGDYIDKYTSISSCSRQLGVSSSTINRALNGECVQGKRYIFKYSLGDKVIPLKNFHKGLRTPLSVIYENTTLEFSTISDCAKHFGIENHHTGINEFARQLFFQDSLISYLSTEKYGVINRNTGRRKSIEIKHPDETLKFDFLKEVCNYYNWKWKSFGYDKRFSKKFYKHFPNSTLIISPSKIS